MWNEYRLRKYINWLREEYELKGYGSLSSYSDEEIVASLVRLEPWYDELRREPDFKMEIAS